MKRFLQFVFCLLAAQTAKSAVSEVKLALSNLSGVVRLYEIIGEGENGHLRVRGADGTEHPQAATHLEVLSFAANGKFSVGDWVFDIYDHSGRGLKIKGFLPNGRVVVEGRRVEVLSISDLMAGISEERMRDTLEQLSRLPEVEHLFASFRSGWQRVSTALSSGLFTFYLWSRMNVDQRPFNHIAEYMNTVYPAMRLPAGDAHAILRELSPLEASYVVTLNAPLADDGHRHLAFSTHLLHFAIEVDQHLLGRIEVRRTGLLEQIDSATLLSVDQIGTALREVFEILHMRGQKLSVRPQVNAKPERGREKRASMLDRVALAIDENFERSEVSDDGSQMLNLKRLDNPPDEDLRLRGAATAIEQALAASTDLDADDLRSLRQALGLFDVRAGLGCRVFSKE